jgi:AcrR family transcriptional regulator
MHAALDLFEVKGYDHTAVREITDAVDVSERTFFRYFASKEDLTLSFIRDGADALLQALAARPPDEEPMTALRRAFAASLSRVSSEVSGRDRKLSYLSILELIESTPALLAAHLRYFHDHDDALVREIAKRESVDPATDPRPRIIATLFAGLVSHALKDWRAQGTGDLDAVLAAFDVYAGQLGPGLFGHWTTTPR